MFLVGAIIGIILWVVGTILIGVYKKNKIKKEIKKGE